MNYQQLPTTYKSDTIAEALYAREVEHFHYAFDAANFRNLLGTLQDGLYRSQVQKRLDDTLVQMANVEAIHAALQSQITDPEAHAAAVARAIAKRSATCNTP